MARHWSPHAIVIVQFVTQSRPKDAIHRWSECQIVVRVRPCGDRSEVCLSSQSHILVTLHEKGQLPSRRVNYTINATSHGAICCAIFAKLL